MRVLRPGWLIVFALLILAALFLALRPVPELLPDLEDDAAPKSSLPELPPPAAAQPAEPIPTTAPPSVAPQQPAEALEAVARADYRPGLQSSDGHAPLPSLGPSVTESRNVLKGGRYYICVDRKYVANVRTPDRQRDLHENEAVFFGIFILSDNIADAARFDLVPLHDGYYVRQVISNDATIYLSYHVESNADVSLVLHHRPDVTSLPRAQWHIRAAGNSEAGQMTYTMTTGAGHSVVISPQHSFQLQGAHGRLRPARISFQSV